MATEYFFRLTCLISSPLLHLLSALRPSLRSTLDKINIMGTDYMDKLLLDVDVNSVPIAFGGKYDKYNEKFDWDYSREGPIWYEGCPEGPGRKDSKSDLGFDIMQAITTGSEKVQNFVYKLGGIERRSSTNLASINTDRRSSGTFEDIIAMQSTVPIACRPGATLLEQQQRRQSKNLGQPDRRRSSARPSLIWGTTKMLDKEMRMERPSLTGEEDYWNESTPTRLRRSLSALSSKVLESSGVVFKREFIDPLYYLVSMYPLVSLLVAMFVCHVLMKLDIVFLRYFLIPLAICLIDMTIGLRF